MKAILLAAGEGSRLRPYTSERPKALVEIGNISMLDLQLEVLSSAGIREQIIIGGYLSDMLKPKGTKLYLNPEYDTTNMVWTLFCAENELSGDLIVSYGDIVYSKQILQELLKSRADISVTIDLNWLEYWSERQENPLNDSETLKLAKDGSILEIGKKPKSLAEIEGQYMGLMKFSDEGINIVKNVFEECLGTGFIQGKPVRNAYMTDLLQEIIDRGYPVQSIPIKDSWVEVDTVEDLESHYTQERVSKIISGLRR